MAEKKKRMLLFGPGFGHNVEGKLRSLTNTSLFDVVFIAYKFDESFREKYPSIKYVPSKHVFSLRHPLNSIRSFLWLYKWTRCSGNYDVVYSLGMGGAIGALLFYLAKKDTKKAFEIWNVKILKKAKRNKSLSERFDRFVIDRADLICQYWWGIRELFFDYFPEHKHKFLMYQLSYPDIYFSKEKHLPESPFVIDFLNRIPKDQIVCFWPRSFIPSNNHIALLEALNIIKNENLGLINNFKLYLWGGNVQREESRHQIEVYIADHSLSQYVEIVEHPFVPQNDIFAIEERSDFFVQIANDDILSTFIMEILCSGKPFVLSNLRTFQFLNEKYDMNIDLVDNNPSEISIKLIEILSMLNKGDKIENKSRREICRHHFSTSKVTPSFQLLYNRL